MCVNNLSKVALDSAAAGIEPATSSCKSNALTTAPPSHTHSAKPYAIVHSGSSERKSVSARWPPTRRPRCKLDLLAPPIRDSVGVNGSWFKQWTESGGSIYLIASVGAENNVEASRGNSPGRSPDHRRDMPPSSGIADQDWAKRLTLAPDWECGTSYISLIKSTVRYVELTESDVRFVHCLLALLASDAYLANKTCIFKCWSDNSLIEVD